MHSKGDNIEIIINDEAEDVMTELFDSLIKNYQIGLEKTMRGNGFIFDCVHLLYHKCHKINLNHGRSYIDSHDWIKSKKATINPINKNDNKCFQYAITVPLNHDQIGKHSERIIKFNFFINKYTWEGINFPSEKDDWKI